MALSKTDQWEGKTGQEIEVFIKNALEKRTGVFWLDEKTGEYLGFSDYANRQAYMLDNTRTDLVLARIKAGGNTYTGEITFLSGKDNVITAEGATAAKLKFYFVIKDPQGEVVADETAKVSITISNGSNQTVYSATKEAQPGGEENFIELDLGSYLTIGTNLIRIDIVGDKTNTAFWDAATYTVYDGICITGGDDAVICGGSVQLGYEVSEGITLQGGVVWSIVADESDYVKGEESISSEGLLKTSRSKNEDRVITVQATASTTDLATLTAKKKINLVEAVYVTGIKEISGATSVMGEKDSTQTYTVILTPSNTGKEINCVYECEWSISGAGATNGYVEIVTQNEKQCTVKLLKDLADGQIDFTITATIGVENSGVVSEISKSLTVTIGTGESAEYKTVEIYIINNNSDPDTMIGNLGSTTIDSIRNKSHRYLGKIRSSDGKMCICQLDDSDSTKYFDGTTAVLTGAEGDVFVRIPPFMYKGSSSGSSINITTSGTPPDDEIDSFVQWAGDELIGAYKASIDSDGKLRSVSGVQPKIGSTYDALTSAAQKTSSYCQLVTWQHHCMMAVLFFAQYFNANSQAKCGVGPKNLTTYMTGSSNTKGMTDTTVSEVDGNTNKSVNFWGLEDWWGGHPEIMQDAEVGLSSGTPVWNVGGKYHSGVLTGAGFITKLKIGARCDMIPTSISGGSESTYFCDYFSGKNSYDNTYLVTRGGGNFPQGAGIVSCEVGNIKTALAYFAGTRLVYKGEVEIINDPAVFKTIS